MIQKRSNSPTVSFTYMKLAQPHSQGLPPPAPRLVLKWSDTAIIISSVVTTTTSAATSPNVGTSTSVGITSASITATATSILVIITAVMTARCGSIPLIYYTQSHNSTEDIGAGKLH